MQNFNFPYFSRNVAEFWRRWHISLSTWFRDYLYIPLGGSRGGTMMKVRNTFIIFIVSGLWHGANWTFIIWGALNAIYFLPFLLTNTNRNHLTIVAKGKTFPRLKEALCILITFLLTVITWIFFRAENAENAFNYISEIFSFSILTKPEGQPITTVLLILIFVIIEWFGREGEYANSGIDHFKTRIVRWFFYLAICMLIFLFQGKQQEFIYFQF